MRTTCKIECLLIILFVFTSFIHAKSGRTAEAKITVEVNKPGHTVSPNLFGIFFEDINLSADGGIYPEMVRNRSFEDADTLENWKFTSADSKSAVCITKADIYGNPPLPPLNAFNRKFLCVDVAGPFMLENSGYWGMNIIQGNKYNFKMAGRTTGGYNGTLKIKLVGSKGNALALGEIKDLNADWKYYSLDLTATASDPKAYLEISGEGKGKLYLDMVSLIPSQTWKNHGLRVDLASAIDSLQPKFLRFPGGCWVEGDNFSAMNHWKHTVGNIDTRTPLWNIWGYNATNGLGFHEYLQLAEDLGAEPLFCINTGISHKEIVPMDQMAQWVQDALDAIEYANGPENSVWGSLRAKNGHPKPFNLKYLEIGNENGQDPYAERWAVMVNAIHSKYPDIKLIANEWAGGHPKEPSPEIIDEHYYNNPDWFIWNANQYDKYDRNGAKIFVGEYAVTTGTGNGNLRGAIGEAAWMIGMERNSDVVVMGSYAPLFCNANHKAWPVNLINYDSYRWFGLPSYYVQKLFSNNQGTVVLPTKIENAPALTSPASMGCIGLGTWMNAAEFKDVVVSSPDGKILFKPGFTKVEEKWRRTGKGDWSVENGVLKQSAIAQGVTLFMGDSTWKDITISLKAKRVSGENGFQIYYHNQSNGERYRWDIGGWGNSLYYMELGMKSESFPGTIEMGRWYDVKIEIEGNTVKGYLDGKLVQEINQSDANISCLFANTVKDEKNGDIILKVVNASAEPVKTQINFSGAENLSGKGTATILTSLKATDENTLENPTKVVPKTEMLKINGASLTRLFPANSLTVIRLTKKN